MSKDDVFSFAISSLIPDIYKLESDDAISGYSMKKNHTIMKFFGKNGLRGVTQAIKAYLIYITDSPTQPSFIFVFKNTALGDFHAHFSCKK